MYQAIINSAGFVVGFICGGVVIAVIAMAATSQTIKEMRSDWEKERLHLHARIGALIEQIKEQ